MKTSYILDQKSVSVHNTREQLAKIPDHIKDKVSYYDQIYHRTDNKLVTNNMATEFIYILEQITEEPFNPSNFKGLEGYSIDEQGESFCLCTKPIQNLFTIEHISTGSFFRVGSDCIEKIDKDLYKQLIKERCKECTNLVLDKRKHYNNTGHCSLSCQKLTTEKLKKACWICKNKKNISDFIPESELCQSCRTKADIEHTEFLKRDDKSEKHVLRQEKKDYTESRQIVKDLVLSNLYLLSNTQKQELAYFKRGLNSRLETWVSSKRSDNVINEIQQIKNSQALNALHILRNRF